MICDDRNLKKCVLFLICNLLDNILAPQVLNYYNIELTTKLLRLTVINSYKKLLLNFDRFESQFVHQFNFNCYFIDFCTMTSTSSFKELYVFYIIIILNDFGQYSTFQMIFFGLSHCSSAYLP